MITSWGILSMREVVEALQSCSCTCGCAIVSVSVFVMSDENNIVVT